ncbi:MAG: hypothetical protein U0T82_13640 [Bacteroidales bacterium]
MKKAILFLTVLLSVTSLMAQLSTRESDPVNLKFGTRPQAGDMSIYFGIGNQELDELDQAGKDVSGLPLISLRYYFSDQMVGRLTLKSISSKEKIKGTLSSNVAGLREDITVSAEQIFVPSLEKHFSPNNIFDAYITFGVPLGIQREIVSQDIKWNIAGDYSSETVTKNSLIYGLEGLVGIQVFIAFLPVSIGIEAGTRGIGYARQQYKHEEKSLIGVVSSSQTYYTTGNDPAVIYTNYKKLKYSKFTQDNEFRIVASYYFRH